MKIKYEDIQEPVIFIDVRSPLEYADGTIGDAVNVPLYLDDHRVEIGTVYKRQSADEAKRIAMKYVAARLPEIYEAVLELEKRQLPLVLFCARGGMRSQSLYALLKAVGHDVRVLDGGYKAYRHVVIEETNRLCKEKTFAVLHGNTGVGKTLILEALHLEGCSVIDIEGMAKHRGSLLGRVGLEPQPSQKQFEHLLLEALKAAKEKVVFIEAESKRLGRNTIPDSVLYGMKSGRHLWISATLEQRAAILVEEYMVDEAHRRAICEVLDRFRKHLSNETVNAMLEDVRTGQGLYTAQVLMEEYYDPKYEYTSDQYIYDQSIALTTPEGVACQLRQWVEDQMPRETLLIEAFDDNVSDEVLLPAARRLSQGATVAFPTETVYGLGANALDELAVLKIFEAKGRPADNPLIVHIVDMEELAPLVREVTPVAQQLMDAFWPGPLTLIMKKAECVAPSVTPGLDTVAVRMPQHELARRLIRLAGCPIAAPSANRSGRPSPTDYRTVIEDLTGRVSAIVCGAPAEIGLESTVVDVTGDEPIVLRPGGVTLEDIQRVTGKGQYDDALNRKLEAYEQPKSPGMKYTHYSPEADVTVVVGSDQAVVLQMQSLVLDGQNAGKSVGVMTFDEWASEWPSGVTVLSLGPKGDLNTIGSRLFTTLRQFDQLGVEVVFAHGVTQEGLGKAIMNRLVKAAGHSVIFAEE